MKPNITPIRSAGITLIIGIAAIGLSGCAVQNSADKSTAPPSAKIRPNVLLIVADDLGYSDLGAFGGEIPTPNLDRLAGEGRLLTNHYVNPTCSPTRASLMSGTDHHLAGLGTMGENLRSVPQLRGRRGYEGYLNERVNWLPELLKDSGYHTYMAGKWHLGDAPNAWPVARGFEASFALLQGGGAHFASVPGKPIAADRPNYVEDNSKVELPADFYSTTTFTDKLIGYLKRNQATGKPFFAYAAYSAPHWPLHAPDEDIAKFKGRYDAGYEVIRSERLARQKALGLLPADFKVAAAIPASADYPTWSMLSPQDRAREARKMEVYAAMVHNMDRNIGRLVQHLKDTGEYNNTMIVFMSDNGAEPSDSFFPNNPNTDNSLDNIGRRLSNVGYGARWAEVSATPFLHFKGWNSEGGIASPAIVRMPGQTRPLPTFTAPTHVSDIAPSVLELAGIQQPAGVYQGRTVLPMTGMNLIPSLKKTEPQADVRQRVIAGELFGGRWLIDGRWKLVSVMTPFGDNTWQLFDVHADRGETTNLATQHPDTVQQLTGKWEDYARRTGTALIPNTRMPDLRWGRRPIPGQDVQ